LRTPYTIRVAYPGNLATSPNLNGSQTVTVAGGQVGAPQQFGIVPTSAVLPLSANPNPFGTHNPDVQTAEVNGLYNLILSRVPDASGGAAAVAYLKGGGSVEALASGLLHSTEYESLVVQADFENYLGRSAPPSSIAAGVAYLQGGGTEDGLADFFLTTPEFNLLHPDNASFVQSLYGDVLGRQGSASEVSFWGNILGTGTSRAQVVQSFLTSNENLSRADNGLYSLFFEHGADPRGLQAGIVYFQSGGTLAQLASFLLGTAEFAARANATVG
jgi:hypothetical protein